MKKSLIALALISGFGMANAAVTISTSTSDRSITVTDSYYTFTFNSIDDADSPSSNLDDWFFFEGNTLQEVADNLVPPTTFSITLAPGVYQYSFGSGPVVPALVPIDPFTSVTLNGDILYFDDRNSGVPDIDSNDFRVSVAYEVSPIPEPETYALMLAGLGVVGFMARRRKADQA